jgi:aminopeptidase N
VTDLRLADGTPLALEEIEDGTLARAGLPAPVAPGESVEIELNFQAQLPRVFARTGYVDDFFMVGQWFPKLGVWEDGDWNAYPFHANAEFYADFGDYDVAITLPDNYVTGAAGLLVSTLDNGDSTQTMHYHAENVIDFAWAASPHFQTTTRQVDGVELLYLYLPEHEWTVKRALDAAEAAVRHYSRWYGPYPYDQLTIVDAPDDGESAGGMEYPTFVTAGPMSFLGIGGLGSSGVDRSLELVIIHEIGHQWWQSMVAFNEAEEPWLDEGFTDYSTLRVVEAVYGVDTSALNTRSLKIGYLDLRRMDYLVDPQLPMYGKAWEFDPLMEYGVAAYSKPVLSLTTLERILGEETMLEIMSAFFQRYQFEHPTTEDFRAVAEAVSGQDLSWFFEGLVYGDGVLNYTVAGVDKHSVTVARQGDLVIPTEVLVTFTDGSTTLEPWDGLETEATFTYPDRPPIRSAEVDPQHKIVIDLRWADNGLSRRVEVSPWLALVTRLLYDLQNALLVLGGL